MLTKYLIIEFLPTLGKYQTGNKYIPFNFFNILLNLKLEKYKEIEKSMNKYSHILNNIGTQKEEYNKLYNFYTKVLEELDYKNYTNKDIDTITNSQVGNIHKIIYNNDINNCLSKLNSQYKLILLINDFPSIIGSLKYHNIDKCFDKIYVTSCYGMNNSKELWQTIKSNYKDYIYVDNYNKLVELSNS